tara:strand:+ start:264 stop:1193 length:930 start_codon:yes stop_codon:yes gene_type:complete
MNINNKKDSCLLIFDVNNYIYRAFYTTSPHSFRRQSDNKATNAVIGTLRMILKTIKHFETLYTHVYPIACFDSPRYKLNRTMSLPSYKAHRPPTPSDLSHQFNWIKSMFPLLNIQSFMIPEYEADDIIASISLQQYQNFSNIIIASSDKDMNQILIRDNILLLNPRNYELQNSNNVFHKYNITPHYFHIYQALIGDKCDNIPGIRGVGPKTASEIINISSRMSPSSDIIYSIKCFIKKPPKQFKQKSEILSLNFNTFLSNIPLVSLYTSIDIPDFSPNHFTTSSLNYNTSLTSFLHSLEIDTKLFKSII